MAVDLESLQTLVGQRFGPFNAWDEVNAPMIRHWCDALGDDNPIYTDIDAARAEGYDNVVAPPTMLQAWVMMGYRGERAPGSDSGSAFACLDVLEEAGYPGVVAVNCEQEYSEYLQPGDQVHYYAELESISEQKTTALGTGYFCTELSTFYNQSEQEVGKMRFRIFKYKPASA